MYNGVGVHFADFIKQTPTGSATGGRVLNLRIGRLA